MSDNYKLLDVVALLVARPDDGLNAGAIGTIVDVFKKPNVAYEVEFCDEDGRTIVMLTLLPAELARFDSA